MDVCNVSMGTTKKGFFAALHNLADRAYFRNTVLVTAANMPHADGWARADPFRITMRRSAVRL